MTAKTITVVIGDTQIGSTTAIAPPVYEIHTCRPNETTPQAQNRLQVELWRWWVDFWDYARGLCGVRGKHRHNRLVVVHLGDVIDGNHHGSNQLVPEIEDQVKMATDILEPIADGADAFFGIFGTDAHDGNSGNAAATIYNRLGARRYDYQMTLDIDGVLMDFAHHGRVGRRAWTSAAASIGTEIMVDCAEQGVPVPRYAFRAHNHVIDDSGEKLPSLRVVCTPSWQLKTAHGWRVSPNTTRSDIGGIIVNGDVLDFSRARYKGQPDGRKAIVV